MLPRPIGLAKYAMNVLLCLNYNLAFDLAGSQSMAAANYAPNSGLFVDIAAE